MVSKAYTEGFYIKPRIDMELLRSHSEGLIALSACLGGEIPRRLQNGDYEGAKKHALEMRELFGEDCYYLELQDHNLPEQQPVISGILRLHEETGIPLVATNDAHYLTREDAAVQDVLIRLPEEYAADIKQSGIRLTGGCALLSGLTEALAEETGLTVEVTQTPQDDVAAGLGVIGRDERLLRELIAAGSAVE